MTRSRMRWLVLLVVALGAVVCSGVAHADCSDAPAPRVDWGRCILDSRDFRGVDLTGVALRDAQFLRADLTGAKLVKVDATRAKFVSAQLDRADFTGARLQDVDFSN